MADAALVGNLMQSVSFYANTTIYIIAGLLALLGTLDQVISFASDLPFALFLRQFGANDSITQRLITEIQAWDSAGRPALQKIRAYPRNSSYTPSKSEVMIERQWTKLIMEWPALT